MSDDAIMTPPVDPEARAAAARAYLASTPPDEPAADAPAELAPETEEPSPAEVRQAREALTSLVRLVGVVVGVARARTHPASARRLAEEVASRAPRIAERLAPRVARLPGLWVAGIVADIVEPVLAERLEAAASLVSLSGEATG